MSQPSSFPFPEPNVLIGNKMFSQHAFEVARFWRVAMIAVERRIRPILHINDVPMLHGIEPAILGVGVQVALVADDVFPIAALPDATLATRLAN